MTLFGTMKPDEEDLPRIEDVRDAFEMVGKILKENCPPSRHLSLALTELEASEMWAVRSIITKGK